MLLDVHKEETEKWHRYLFISNGRRDGSGVGRRFEFFSTTDHLHHHAAGLHLQLVSVDDVLIGRTALGKRFQAVHFPDVLPQVSELDRNVIVQEEPSGHPNVLQLGHQFRVETAQSVAGQKPASSRSQFLLRLTLTLRYVIQKGQSVSLYLIQCG